MKTLSRIARAALGLSLTAALGGCVTTATPYPERWERTLPLRDCGAIAGTWADSGSLIHAKGSTTRSLSGLLRILARMQAFDGSTLAESGPANRAVDLSSPRSGVLRVRTLLVSGSDQRSEDFDCRVVDGWAQIGDWELGALGSGVPGGSGMGFGPVNLSTRSESLEFRKNKTGELVVRWLTRDSTYVMLIPLNDARQRWLRFKPASTAPTPPAAAPTPRNPR